MELVFFLFVIKAEKKPKWKPLPLELESGRSRSGRGGRTRDVRGPVRPGPKEQDTQKDRKGNYPSIHDTDVVDVCYVT